MERVYTMLDYSNKITHSFVGERIVGEPVIDNHIKNYKENTSIPSILKRIFGRTFGRTFG